MSRGLGRRERELLHLVYHAPTIAPSGARYVHPRDVATSPSDLSSLSRAARRLARKGLVRSTCSNRIEPLREVPAELARCVCLSVHKIPNLVTAEHLGGAA